MVVTAVLCLSDADLGAPDDELAGLKADRDRAPEFRTVWCERLMSAIADEDSVRVSALLLTPSHDPDGGDAADVGVARYPAVPLQRLLDLAHGASALVIVATEDMEPCANLIKNVLQSQDLHPSTLARPTIVTVAPLQGFGLRPARAGTIKALGGGKGGDGGVGPDSVRLVVGAGAAQLNLGVLVGALESSPSVNIIDVRTGAHVTHEIPVAPLRWLLRRRYFGSAAAVLEAGPEAPARAEFIHALRILDQRQDLYPATPAPTLEDAFFDQVASRSVQAVFMGRAWLEDRFLAVGGKPLDGSGKQIGPDAGRSWLGTTIQRKGQLRNPRARQMLKDCGFLNALATPKASGKPHPVKSLPLTRARLLRPAEEDAQSRDPRRLPGGLPEGLLLSALPFPATPNGRCLLIRCVGMRESLDGETFPFVDPLGQDGLRGLTQAALGVDRNQVESNGA